MIKKYIIVLEILVIIVVVIFSMFVKNSIIYSSIEQVKEENMRVSIMDYIDYYYEDVDETPKLDKYANAIAIVEPIDEGTQRAYSTLRKCKIIKMHKGNQIEEEMYIYEPNYIVGDRDYMSISGYTSMQVKRQYLVLLKKVETPHFVNNKELTNGYYFVNPIYGKFEKENYAKISTRNEEGEVYFDDINNKPIYLEDETIVEKYNIILDELWKMYN